VEKFDGECKADGALLFDSCGEITSNLMLGVKGNFGLELPKSLVCFET
jgi:hypothetical protein